MAKPPSLNSIAYFEAVARLGKMNKAAEEMFISSSALSQQVRTLEEQLGVKLFRRVNRDLILTAEGELLFVSASQAIGLLRRVEEQISLRLEVRTLVVRVAPSFGTRWLMRRLPDFIRMHPHIDVHIDATSELTDFGRENVDLEIHYGDVSAGGLSIEPLISDLVMPMCSPGYLDQIQGMSVVDAIKNGRLIHTVKSSVTWRDWLNHNNLISANSQTGLRFDRSVMSLHMASEGLGIALESTTLAVNELEQKTLVPAFPDLLPIERGTYWLVYPSQNLRLHAVDAFREWLMDEISTFCQSLKTIQRDINVEE